MALAAFAFLLTGCSQTLDLGRVELESGADLGDTPDSSVENDASDAGNGDVGMPLPTANVDPLRGVTEVAMGHEHGCAIAFGGELYCWGSNDFGQLGVGDGETRNFAVRVGEESDWKDVVVGHAVTCATRSDGRLFCWGSSEWGQLGLGETGSKTVPIEVTIPGSVEQITADNHHVCAINDSAELYCWGDNRESNCGQGTNRENGTPSYSEPVRVDGVGWLDVEAGDGHTCGLTTDFRIECWGRNTNGQTGVEGSIQTIVPGDVGPPNAGKWVDITMGAYMTCAVTDLGEWYCWGSAGGGKLPGEADDVTTPKVLGVPQVFETVVPGAFHVCGNDRTGTTTCWGRNLDAMIDEVDIGEVFEPQPVGVALGPHVRVELGRFTTCVIDSANELHCRGENGGGRLGAGVPPSDTSRFVPVGTRRPE